MRSNIKHLLELGHGSSSIDIDSFLPLLINVSLTPKIDTLICLVLWHYYFNSR